MKSDTRGLRCLAVLTVVLCISGNLLAYSGGTGEPNNPYQIATKEDLLALSVNTADYNKCFVLMSDIDLEGQVFTKAIIAASNSANSDFEGTSFTGIFNGNGHKITHFGINAGSNCFLGVFGYIGDYSGSVENLGIENFSISASTFSQYVGALAGYVNGDIIRNCYSIGDVSGYEWVGGLVGHNWEDSIINCYSDGTVTGKLFVGGLLGGNSNGSVNSCYSMSSVTGSNASGLGGLVGQNTEEISNCYATGPVIGYSDSEWVGGLVGSNPIGNINNCYSTGFVSGTNYTGGLIGNSIGYNVHAIINSCFWDIETSGQLTSSGGVGKTTAQMKMLSTFTFAGWDFNTPVWTINEGVDYPHLSWENTTPVAQAGPDKVVYARVDGIADVMLDGSDSNDADGDELTYKWTWTIDANTYEANSVSPTIKLPVGVHTIQLMVNDGYADSAPDDVNVTVVAPLEGNLKITPQTINRKSNQPHIQAIIQLPDGLAMRDIDFGEPLILYPGEIKATKQSFAAGNGISADFNKDALMAAVPANGRTELKVAGKLKSGRYFCGDDKVMIISPLDKGR